MKKKETKPEAENWSDRLAGYQPITLEATKPLELEPVHEDLTTQLVALTQKLHASEVREKELQIGLYLAKVRILEFELAELKKVGQR